MPEHPGPFKDRTAAGRQLAARLRPYAHRPGVLVLGLPRGGVPVAHPVAQALGAPLDLCLVRKLGVPGQPELAMGAIASGGVRVLNDEVVNWLEISAAAVEAVAARELRELQRRDRVYRGDRPPPEIRDRTVILVDDGIATGWTMRAAIQAVGRSQPARLVVAVPVAPPQTYHALRAEVDEVVCLLAPQNLYSISLWYDDFAQTTDAEVCALLANQPWDMPLPGPRSP